MAGYRVNLDIYNGPMDLLLYLIRREEVDIHDIPIARITEQYCAYVGTLEQLDPDLAGEFLVLAATLMEIKTRMLLPSPTGGDEDGEPIDPRADLVRQLLQYKAFKDAAGQLRSAAADQALRFPRRPPTPEDHGRDIEDVQLWDLVEAFNSLMTAVGRARPQTEIIYDDTPIEVHAAEIMDRLRRDGNMPFSRIFAGCTNRSELIGLFLAILELARRRSIVLEQQRPFAEIHIFLNPEAPPDGEQDTQAPPGQYVGESPPPPRRDDDAGTEADGSLA